MLKPGSIVLYVIYLNQKAFTTDDRVAWAHITIPEKVFSGEAVEDWWNLSGKQGDGKEGMINMVLSYTVSKVEVCMHMLYVCKRLPTERLTLCQLFF